MEPIDESTLWYQTNLDVFLNRWYSNYAEASHARAESGGFLLPYKHHFFICESRVIEALGLEPTDPDWEKIGWDCVQPEDAEAYRRLRAKRESVIRKNS